MDDDEKHEDGAEQQRISPNDCWKSPSMLPIYSEEEDRITNVFSRTPPRTFNVRGEDYLWSRKKIVAGQSQYSLIGIDNIQIRNSNYMERAHEHPQSSYSKARKAGFKGFVFILNFVVPNSNFIGYWTPTRFLESEDEQSDAASGESEPLKDYCTGHPIFDKLMCQFVEGEDEYRNSRLKVIPSLVEGHWLLSKVVNRPAIMCNKIATTWYTDISPEGNYMEAVVTIASSTVAQGIFSLVVMSAKMVCLDLGFLIEGQDDEELPEEMFCAMRFHKLDPHSAPFLDDLEKNENQDSLKMNGVAPSNGDDGSNDGRRSEDRDRGNDDTDDTKQKTGWSFW